MATEGLSNRDRELLFEEAVAALGNNPQALNELVATAAAAPIAEQIVEEGVVRFLFPVNRITTPTTTYTLKKRQSVAVRIHKMGAAPETIIRQERVQVEPYIISKKHMINEIDILDANYAIVQDALDDAAKEIAELEDNEVLRVLDKYAPIPGGAWPANTETLSVNAGPTGVGQVLSGNAFRIGSSAPAPDGGIAGDPRVQDLARAQTYLRMIGYDPKTILGNPWGVGKLIGQHQFLFAERAGDNSVLKRGVITDVLGNRIVTSRRVNKGDFFVMDENELAVWIERNALTIKTSQHDLMNIWLLWERACPFVRNANSYIRVIFNT